MIAVVLIFVYDSSSFVCMIKIKITIVNDKIKIINHKNQNVKNKYNY